MIRLLKILACKVNKKNKKFEKWRFNERHLRVAYIENELGNVSSVRVRHEFREECGKDGYAKPKCNSVNGRFTYIRPVQLSSKASKARWRTRSKCLITRLIEAYRPRRWAKTRFPPHSAVRMDRYLRKESWRKMRTSALRDERYFHAHSYGLIC